MKKRRDALATLELGKGRTFSVVISDLLCEPVDAIVNAANGGLAHGAGVAAAIARAAGQALEDEGDAIVKARGLIPTGEAVVTTAGRLPYKGVIHAVGPAMGQGDEEAKLASAIQNALLRAHEKGWRSVSFPAVSSGIFSVPLAVCARGYVKGVRAFFAAQPATTVATVRLVLLEEGPLAEHVAAAMKSG